MKLIVLTVLATWLAIDGLFRLGERDYLGAIGCGALGAAAFSYAIELSAGV